MIFNLKLLVFQSMVFCANALNHTREEPRNNQSVNSIEENPKMRPQKSNEKNVFSTNYSDDKYTSIENENLLESTSHNLLNSIKLFRNRVIGNVKTSSFDVQFDTRRREDAYENAGPKQSPYTVFIRVKSKSGDGFVCSGALLTASWVLTSAHCMYDAKDKIVKSWVYAGISSYVEFVEFRKNKTIHSTAQVVKVKHAIYHPRYPVQINSYDIALLKVAEEFNITDYVKTIKLSTKPWRHRGYKHCVTTGFGVVRDFEKSKDDFRKKISTLEVKMPCLCNFMIKFIFKYLDGDEAGERFLCSKPRQDYGICSGDSGGALVCEEDGEMKIQGINTMTVQFDDAKYCELNIIDEMLVLDEQECGDKNMLSLFQYTYLHLPWINHHIRLFTKTEMEAVIENTRSAGMKHRYGWNCAIGVCVANLMLCRLLHLV